MLTREGILAVLLCGSAVWILAPELRHRSEQTNSSPQPQTLRQGAAYVGSQRYVF